MNNANKKSVLKGTIWSGIERFSAQGIAFIVMIFMARLLTPADYGLVGMLTVFIAICQALVDGGFSQALIHKQDRSEIDNSTVFYFNILASIILYFILFFLAPLIAVFYNESMLIPLTRIISLSIIINSFAVVQRALLSINLNFKIQAQASIIASIISGIIGIITAYLNKGVWSIVIYQLCNFTINTLLLWIFSKWRPILQYSKESFNTLFKYGSKLAITSILSSIYDNLFLIVIGKIYRPIELGYYTRAFQFAYLPSANISQITQRVIFPVLCQSQNNDLELIKRFKPLLSTISFIVFPLMFGLIGVSHSIIPAFLGEQWKNAAPILQVLCLSLMWYPLQYLNISLLQAKGRTDLVLKIDFIKKIIGISFIAIFAPFGVLMLCIGNVCSTIVAVSIHLYYTNKIIGLNCFLQLKTISKSLVGSLLICGFSSLPILIIENYFIQLITGIINGILIYFIFNYFTNRSELINMMNLIKGIKLHG